MAGPNTRDLANQWCIFITQPTNGVTSSLTQSVTDIHFCTAGPAVVVQPKTSEMFMNLTQVWNIVLDINTYIF
uniref:Uncharacterized protein n=1 Tax=Anguilla anguilla TaxID=7936 RepID=A0A0E9VCA4_ANGAN